MGRRGQCLRVKIEVRKMLEDGGGSRLTSSLFVGYSYLRERKPYSIFTKAFVISDRIRACSLLIWGISVLPCPANGITLRDSINSRNVIQYFTW